jgi:hypothetical protein
MIMLVWLMVISIYNHENENYGSWIHMDTIRWIWFLNTTYLFIKHDLMVMVIFH